MPDRETIISHITELPVISVGTMAGDEQIWEANERGAYFKVTRERMPVYVAGILAEVYSLSVSGTILAKNRIVRDFTKALGQPLQSPYELPGTGIAFLIWDAQKLDRTTDQN